MGADRRKREDQSKAQILPLMATWGLTRKQVYRFWRKYSDGISAGLSSQRALEVAGDDQPFIQDRLVGYFAAASMRKLKDRVEGETDGK